MVTSDRDVLAAFKLDELNAVGFNAAFVDFVEGVMLVADHWLRNGGVSPLIKSIPQKYACVLGAGAPVVVRLQPKRRGQF